MPGSNIRSVQPAEPILQLSSRETQVLEYASRGWTNAQIALELNVTAHAIKFHLAATYRKLGVPNRTTAVALYLRGFALGDSHPG
jgi:DNA-binding NarL/FixJ family response regulator